MAGTIDDRKFKTNVDNLVRVFQKKNLSAVRAIALELQRLSSFEVPHDLGLLQTSSSIQSTGDSNTLLFGYNKVYAARLHENPQFKFQKGRKGKYVEDPIKHNLKVFREFYRKELSEAIT